MNYAEITACMRLFQLKLRILFYATSDIPDHICTDIQATVRLLITIAFFINLFQILSLLVCNFLDTAHRPKCN
jgi:hypothetical protein